MAPVKTAVKVTIPIATITLAQSKNSKNHSKKTSVQLLTNTCKKSKNIKNKLKRWEILTMQQLNSNEKTFVMYIGKDNRKKYFGTLHVKPINQNKLAKRFNDVFNAKLN